MPMSVVVSLVRNLVPSWDVRRSTCLGKLTYALMRSGRLGVAEIGRFVPSPTTDKHHIKSVDRFLGNNALDLVALWAGLIRLACRATTRLFVLLDWTGLGNGFEVLKATVSYGGRSWYLATNLRGEKLTAQDVVDGYKKRMRIEHAFRDEKSMRFGFQLRSVRLTTIERYDRLFAIAALAMLFLVMIGAYVERHGQHKGFKANTSSERTHSLLRLGLHFLHRLQMRRAPMRLMEQAFTCAFDAPCAQSG